MEIADFDGLSLDEIVGRRRMEEDVGDEQIPVGDITYLTSNDNTIATFPNYFLPEHSDHDPKFCLDSFHFHWGKTDDYGSEHTFNGQHYPLEAHFVHYSWYDLYLRIVCNLYKPTQTINK